MKSALNPDVNWEFECDPGVSLYLIYERVPEKSSLSGSLMKSALNPDVKWEFECDPGASLSFDLGDTAHVFQI
ncbi:hypothetical protein L6452_42059 [Arctium lappa]|uniref:Uncharacterized protein n=1 Tax=Arctium lappa TaxID=4217 RepID=A0ACB8XHF5_ARCLA|nr:hypothetical protein L6452_42059 [Arctium lappa]